MNAGNPLTRRTGLLFLAVPALCAGLFANGGVFQGSGSAAQAPVPLQARSSNDTFAADAWEQRLTDPDLDRRLGAFEELSRRASREPGAREQLEAWAAGGSGELAWTARLLLRELESRGHSRRHAPFGGDLFDDLFGGQGPGSGFRDLHMHFGDPFAELEERMRELERNFGRSFGPGAGAPPFFGPPQGGGAPGMRSSGRSVNVEVQPDGVRVRIREMRDGEEHVEEYEADSIEALLEQHPELEGSIGSMRTQRVDPRQSAPRRGALGAQRPMLGIEFTPLDPERAVELGVEAGVGLEVRSVLPGSLAERLGLVAGDVVIELAGRPLRDAADVRAALASQLEGSATTAKAIGADGTTRELRASAAQNGLEHIERRRM